MNTTQKTLAILTLAILGTLPALAGLAWPLSAQTPETFEACYVPDVGAVYLVNRTGLPDACLDESHMAITWTDGGPGSVTTHAALDGLEADDHPQYVLVDGVRDATDGFAVTGTAGSGTIPASGAGVRLMWYAGKAAFRAGMAEGAEWDNANVGARSTAFGEGTTASGSRSTAMGENTTASGDHSAAMGSGTVASGEASTAMGDRTTASGSATTAMGTFTTASGVSSTAMGYAAEASGFSSTAMGRFTSASGTRSLATGHETSASGVNATAMGDGTTAQAFASLVIGRFNAIEGTEGSWVDTDPLFLAGNGSSAASRSNALTLYKNGDLTIAGTLTESSDARLKRDVEPLGDALAKLREIQAVRYRFREGIGHPKDVQIGLIAQEVEAAFPELVTRDSEGYLSLAYAKLTAVLLRGLQEQQDQIEAQRASIEDLVRRVERLETTASNAVTPNR